MIEVQKNIKSFVKLLLILILLSITSCELEECEKDKPIKFGTECLSKYCTESQFQSGECIKSNSIIKTQWLNNIILVGEKNFRYINFITSGNGKTIFYSTPNPHSNERIYFGINSIGDPIFKDSNDIYTYIYKKYISGDEFDTYESISGVIRIDEDTDENKEYFISIGKSKTNTEIFDFNNYEDEIKLIKYQNIVEDNIEIYLGNLIQFIENNKHYYIIGLIKRQDQYNHYFYLLKFNIYYNSNEISCQIQKSEFFNSADNKITYCYLSSQNIIICLYITNNKYFKFLFFNTNLQKKGEQELSIQYSSSVRIFFKYFHYKDNLDLFVYYQEINGNYYPKIQIFETKITESSYSLYMNESIVLNKYLFDKSIILTDIIILRDNFLCLASTETNKETLIIVLINFYNGMEYNLRYYFIDFFSLYNHKFYRDIKLHPYNNNIAFGFSFCYNEACNDDNDEHYTSLIIFSYPNITEYNLDVIGHLNKEENNNVIINLSDHVNIDNNIFGFIIYQIRIYSIDNCGINFISNKTNEAIKKNDYLSKNENLQLYFTENEYQIKTCSIMFKPIITEPDYEDYNKYPIFILKESDENDKKNFEKRLYEGKNGYYNISINQKLTTNCEEENYCNLCFQNDITHCLICKNKYNFIDNRKICIKNETQGTNIKKDCEVEDIVKGNCPNITLTNEELKETYWYIKKEVLNKNYTRENIIIPTSDIYFQICKLEEQEKSNLYISSIDLNECEKILKEKNNIDDDESLIIFKVDIANKELSTTYVKYEIYNPYTLEQLDLSCCDESNIKMNIPVELDLETISLYGNLNQYGYNLFNPNDSFYNDICTPYKSENGTDLILLDRRKDIYMKNGNKTLCQSDCIINEYNITVKRAVCQCSVQYEKKEPDLNDATVNFTRKDFINSFFITLKNSNFLVLKCYKLVFDFNNFLINIGMIIMTIILIISIILIIIHYIKEQNKICYYIELVLKMKFFIESLEKTKIKKKSNRSVNLEENNIKILKKEEKIKKLNDKRKSSMCKIINNKEPPKKIYYEKTNKYKVISNKSEYSKISNKNLFDLKNNEIKESNKKKQLDLKNIKKLNKNKIKKKNNTSSNSLKNFVKKEWIKELESLDPSKIHIINKLTEHELNTLEYKLAIVKDNRTYIQYYWSLLKKKHLILFTFIPIQDYNLFSIKLFLFIFSLSLSFTINGFFFSDETMHKIYENNGKFTFLLQIIQILYSTLICAVINTILKLLSLSENKILEIKGEQNFELALDKSKDVKKYIKIKYILFFVLGFLLLSFFWYFISCFCIVYNNTQIILIKDTLISFALSYLYPFGLNLIPGIFRIYALRAKNKDKKCIYQTSQLIALF